MMLDWESLICGSGLMPTKSDPSPPGLHKWFSFRSTPEKRASFIISPIHGRSLSPTMETSTSTSLRRACQNCTKAKRRCAVRLPSCERCSKKGLECSYNLEPVLENKKPLEGYHGDDQDGGLSHCIIHALEALGSQRQYYRAIRMVGGRTSLEYLIRGLARIPDLARRGRPSPFTHPKLRFDNYHTLLAETIDRLTHPSSQGLDDQKFKDILASDIISIPFDKALSTVQSLMLHLLIHLFSPDPATQAKAESHFGTLSEKAQHLERLARDRVLRGLSPWQAWLQGESTRRTILTSYVLVCAHTSWRHGYCMHRLDFEAFPFDGRPGLWMAESAQAWIAAAGEVHGEMVGPRLVSFHEFGGENPRMSWDPEGDIFLDMMVVAHKGKLRRLPNGEFGWGHEERDAS